jgi:hypothetical protein
MIENQTAPASKFLDQGSYTVSYAVLDQVEELDFPKLLKTIDRSTVRHTGWPPFWVPTRDEIRPKPIGQAIVCNLFSEKEWQADPAHCDFWMVTKKARAVLIRGFQEDGMVGSIPRGTGFDITLPVWRMGECILQASEFANRLGKPDSDIEFQCEWRGLKGRILKSYTGNRMLFDRHKCESSNLKSKMTFKASDASNILPELLLPFLKDLYALFNFFELSKRLVDEEIQRLRSGRF